MKANELRSGSIISINGKFAVVDHIRSHDFSTTINDGFTIIFNNGNLETDDNDTIEPIPLTPSVLEAAGFKKENNGWNKDKKHKYDENHFGLFDHNYCSGELKLMYNVANGPIPEIKCLHQLQNLYFSLTGTELEIDIKKLR